MTASYHLWQNEKATGPFTLGQLRAMWNGGQLTGQDLFSMNAGQQWHFLNDILADLEPPVAKIVSQNTEVVDVLQKIAKSQAETRTNTGCVRTAVIGVFLAIAAIVIWYVLLIAGAHTRGAYSDLTPEQRAGLSQ
jgi:hypothetical protein